MAPPPHVDTALEAKLRCACGRDRSFGWRCRRLRLTHVCRRGKNREVRHSFVVSDPRQPDCPVVFASQEFLDMTGYSAKEVIGRNCRFMQGPKTSKRSVAALRCAVNEQRPCQVRLLNYRKDGSTFWNLLHIAPVFGQGRKLATCFVGVQTEVEAPEKADELMEEDQIGCEENTMEKIAGALEELGPRGEEVEKETGTLKSSLLLTLMTVQQSFVLVDAKAKDMPIMHASRQFCAMCGYPEREVLGRNCRFLQGEGTCREEVAKITDAISRKKPVTVRLLNYRKDGTPFWNSLHIAPIRNADGEVEFFIGVQIDVTAADALEPKHPEGVTMQERLQHSGAVGAVRVAVRAQSGHKGEGLSRCL